MTKTKKYKPRQKWTPERKQRAIDLYVAGKTIQEVTKILGTSARHVGNVLKEAGVTRDKRLMYRGAGNPAWKGGRVVDKTGYILLYKPEHPTANNKGYVREHRLVMEEKLGRSLMPSEVVHHIDGDSANNSPENLELFASNGEHLAHELAGRCPNWSKEGKQRLLDAGQRKADAAKARREHAKASNQEPPTITLSLSYSPSGNGTSSSSSS
jgi:hypothetical protein